MSEDIILIVDNSASVSQYSEQYIRVINSLIQDNPNTNITCVVFNDRVRYLCTCTNTNSITKSISADDIKPAGMLALYDCVSGIIHRMLSFYEKTKKKRPLVVILTNDVDTASKRLTIKQAFLQIAMAKVQGWKFVFFGCTRESVRIGRLLGCNVCVLYDKTDKSFNTIPYFLSECHKQIISEDFDSDIREIKDVEKKTAVDE